MGISKYIDGQTSDPVKPKKGISAYTEDIGNTLDTRVNMGRPTYVNIDEYRDYMPEGVNSFRDLNKLRAQRQSTGEQIFRTIGNTLVNIPLGIVEAVGYLPELFDPSGDYTNDLVETMERWKSPFGEVYRENPEETFDLGDPAWWFNSLGQLTESAAAFAVPGAGYSKLLGSIGKGVTQGLKLGKTADKFIRGTSMLGTSSLLAYTEGAMSGRRIYDEVYNTQLQSMIRQGATFQEADVKARKLASEGAATTVRLNTAMNTVMNLAALAPLFRNGENKVQQWLSKEGRRAEGESLSAWKQRLAAAAEKDPSLKAALKYRSGLTSLPSAMFAEGTEEVNTQFAEKTGLEAGKVRVKKDLDFISDYFDKVGDSEGMLNFVLGAVGGAGQTVLLDHIPVHRVVRYDSAGKPLYKNDPNITEGENGKRQYQTMRVSSKTRDTMHRQQYFNNAKDAILADIDWFTSKNDELQKAMTAKDFLKADAIRHEIFSAHNLNAIMTGTADSWTQEYERIAGMDNTKDLAEPYKQQLQELQAQIAQTPADQQTPLQQMAAKLQDKIVQMEGKTEAMEAGYALDNTDNTYKERARKAVEDIKWMTQLYNDLRTNYVDDMEPHSEELTGHIFSREVMQRVNKRVMDEEEASLSKDEAFMETVTSFNHKIALANRIGERLQADLDNLREARDQNNLQQLLRLAGKYGIVVNDNSELPKAMDNLVARIQERIDKHSSAVQKTIDDRDNNVEFQSWLQSHPGMSFQDYMNYLKEYSLVDPRLLERRAALEHMREQWDEAQQSLLKVKSVKGIRRFLDAAKKDKEQWKRQQEQKNMNDNIQAFLRLADKASASKLDTMERLQVVVQLKRELKLNIEKTNEVKQKIERIQQQLDALANKTGTFKNITAFTRKRELQREINSAQAELRYLETHRKMIEQKLEAAGEQVEQAKAQETPVDTIPREVVTGDPATNPPVVPATVNAPVIDEVQPQAAPASQEAMPKAADSGATDPVQAYLDLKNTLPGEVLNILDMLESMQDAKNYSYDMSAGMLAGAVENQLISADTMHDVILKQKEYMEANQNAPARVDTTPEPVPEEESVEEIDVSDPSMPMVPMISAHIQSPEMDRRMEIAFHVGDKNRSAMKVNSASIEYLSVETTPTTVIDKDGNVVEQREYRFIPLYNRLDMKANHNVLKPGFIKPGDVLEFRIDEEFTGEINFDKTNANDEYGMPKKREEKAIYHMTSGGKIMMDNETGDGFANIPIKIVHAASGEVIGYLPRTDWITAQFDDAINFRNIEDTITLPDGTVITGNVEAQRKDMVELRKRIALAYNSGERATVTTSVKDIRPGHIFYNTDVDIDKGTYKLAPRLMENLLPAISPKNLRPGEKPLQVGIIDHGTLNIGHRTPYSGPANFTEEQLVYRFGKAGGEATNVPVVLLPMPNGAVSVSPLYTRELKDRPKDIELVVNAIEAYLAFGTDSFSAFHQTLVDKIKEATTHGGTARGLDITTETDLELFINQYYTYTRHFGERHTKASAKKADDKKKAEFMLDIPATISGEKKSRIKVGTRFSGAKPIEATLQDGKLHPDFRDALVNGLAKHYKVLTYTRGDIRGINDSRPFHSLRLKSNGTIDVIKHDSYNEYMASFTDTIVYGKHRIGPDGKESFKGQFVYGANPVIQFDHMEALDSLVVADKESVAALPAENQEWEDTGELFDEDAVNLHSSGVILEQELTIENSIPVNLENLTKLQQDTPASQRNSRTPEEVLRELYASGITEIDPDSINPFLKC